MESQSWTCRFDTVDALREESKAPKTLGLGKMFTI